MKAVFGLLVILIGGVVLYNVLPVYWGNFKLGQMLNQQAIVYTYTNKSDDDIANAIAEKARGVDVPLTPEQIKVTRTAGALEITADYTVHVDMPFYPMDMNFKTTSQNKNVMK